MRDVLTWALPTATVLSFITLSTALATGMFPELWSRGVPSVLLLVTSSVGLLLMRRGKLLAAVTSLTIGLAVVFGAIFGAFIGLSGNLAALLRRSLPATPRRR